MNYYERHIGDYLKDTAHLSLLEHGIYGRLLDVYYTRESPIPRAQVERLIGVRSKEERSALECVLSEFFQVDGDVLRHSRCDREIERYQGKQIKAAASANARWNKQKKGGDRMPNADADGMRTHMRTHCEGNAPRHQTPDTSNQYQRAPLLNEEGGGQPIGPDGPARAGFEKPSPESAVQAMAGAGLGDCSPGNPTLLALLQGGITLPELVDAAGAAAKVGKSFAWALARAEGKRRDAVAAQTLPPVVSALNDPDSSASVDASARQLGVAGWDQTREQWAAYKARVVRAREASREAA